MELSPDERKSGILSESSLQTACSFIRTEGYVLFERVLPESLIETLHQDFLKLLERYIEDSDPNRGAYRYQMHLPFAEPFCRPELITNPLIIPIAENLLGEDLTCNYLASDTPLPGSEYQSVHSDTFNLFPEVPVGLPPACLALNIPLVDFTPQNGPLEIWPGGSHMMPGGQPMHEMAPKMHSETVLMPAGSLLLRDMRMWHRGTPNHSDHARPNIALIYSRPWLKSFYPRVDIAQSVYNALPAQAQRLFRFENIT